MSEKKYTVYYSPAAKDDLKSVYSYIAFTLLEKKTAADQTNRIRKEIRSLNVFPERYQLVEWEPWHQMGIRQISVDNYVVYYRVNHKTQRVEIVRIFYGGHDVESIIRA
ncbi:type II toxin-antitoxin system RelE/ParE family toxin [Oscillospiraceae bacterium 44-5]